VDREEAGLLQVGRTNKVEAHGTANSTADSTDGQGRGHQHGQQSWQPWQMQPGPPPDQGYEENSPQLQVLVSGDSYYSDHKRVKYFNVSDGQAPAIEDPQEMEGKDEPAPKILGIGSSVMRGLDGSDSNSDRRAEDNYNGWSGYLARNLGVFATWECQGAAGTTTTDWLAKLDHLKETGSVGNACMTLLSLSLANEQIRQPEWGCLAGELQCVNHFVDKYSQIVDWLDTNRASGSYVVVFGIYPNNEFRAETRLKVDYANARIEYHVKTKVNMFFVDFLPSEANRAFLPEAPFMDPETYRWGNNLGRVNDGWHPTREGYAAMGKYAVDVLKAAGFGEGDKKCPILT
jgi:lysophospholipase L1-like esterase